MFFADIHVIRALSCRLMMFGNQQTDSLFCSYRNVFCIEVIGKKRRFGLLGNEMKP